MANTVQLKGDALAHSLAYERAVNLLEDFSAKGNCGWLDTSVWTAGEREHLQDALFYLEERGLLEHAIGMYHVVRILDQAKGERP